MPKNKMSDLRNHLFATLEALQDPDKPMDISRARAVSDVAQTIIDSAKAELEFMRLMNLDKGSEFFETPEGLDVRRKRGSLEGNDEFQRLGR